MGQKLIYILPLALFTALALFAGSVLLQGKDPSVIDSPVIDSPVPVFKAEALRSDDIQGPALINFFASWCLPCEAEHGILMALSREIPIYGVNYKDTPESREKFLKRLGNPYKTVGTDQDGDATIAFGVYGMPSTFVIDKYNIIKHRYDAPLTIDDLDTIRSLVK